MGKKVIVTPRFDKDLDKIYNYLLKDWSAKVAFDFLEKIAIALKEIEKHPAIGQPSKTKVNVRSIILKPHNRIYFKDRGKAIYVLSIFDMRQHPSKNRFQ